MIRASDQLQRSSSGGSLKVTLVRAFVTDRAVEAGCCCSNLAAEEGPFGESIAMTRLCIAAPRGCGAPIRPYQLSSDSTPNASERDARLGRSHAPRGGQIDGVSERIRISRIAVSLPCSSERREHTGMMETEPQHLRVLIANEKRERLELLAQVVTGSAMT